MKPNRADLLTWAAVLTIIPALVFLFMIPEHPAPGPEMVELPPVARPLKVGETNPPLTLIATNWPLPEGAALYFRSNQSSYGTVLRSVSDFMTAHDEPARAVRVKWTDGGEGWILFDFLEKNYYSVSQSD